MVLRRSLEKSSEAIVEAGSVTPPLLSDESLFTFSAAFRYPFVQQPIPCGKGASDNVYEVYIAKGHLKAAGYKEGAPVACKVRRKEDGITWEMMLREVEALRARKHENIVPLFASYTAGWEDPFTTTAQQEYLHMLFQFSSGGDMEAWLTSKEGPGPLAHGGFVHREIREQYVFKAMHDLASGLAYIHREIDGGMHIWKISNFGKPNIIIDDGNGMKHTNDNEFGTYEYQPPEYFAGPDAGYDAKHGRPFDVYSLGCIFLELVTILLYGWVQEGLPEFERQREANTIHECNGPANKTPDISFHNNRRAVESWIDHLERKASHDRDSYDRVFQVLELIRDMLEERLFRLFAWEIDIEIYSMLHTDASEAYMKMRLTQVAQHATQPLTVLDNRHNPLQRVKEMGRPNWWLDILRSYGWTDSSSTKRSSLGNEELTPSSEY
ncbi:kinase-like domain-containing protein [Lophiotrema nucula]|uniref:non-specific serine/threonine protein kinase n=1 Tax=Lophiotrema nucula TaxID=690887 RepID=A0A6A5YWR7_9PLEO|nr:kinase-like domain-containing protein [Lophiotrema nucula]